jgi:hypothetical protein
VEQAISATGAKRAEIISFLNACACVGCLLNAPPDVTIAAAQQLHSAEAVVNLARANTSTNPLPPPPSAPQRGFVGLLGKLRNALNFGAR